MRYFLDARKNISILTEIQRIFFLLLKFGFDVKEYFVTIVRMVAEHLGGNAL